MQTNVIARNYEAVFNTVNDFIDLKAIADERLPASVPKTDLNALLLTVRAALLKAAAFDELTSSTPNFELFREMAVISGYSESELNEYDLKAQGFMDAHNTFFTANDEIEKELEGGDYVFYNEAGYALHTLDEGDE